MSGYTALHFAARATNARNCVNLLDLLIKGGAALDLKTESNQTPLRLALNRNMRRIWPVLLRAGAEILTEHNHPYILRVKSAGGYNKYAQKHIAAMTKLSVANGRRLPPEVVRHILKYWLHAGYY